MDLAQRIQRTNTPTYGTVNDERIDKKAMSWIMADVDNIPDNAYFFLKFVCNNSGKTVSCEIVVEVNGETKGPYDVYGETTCSEALASFNI
jgi:hypothetical protein